MLKKSLVFIASLAVLGLIAMGCQSAPTTPSFRSCEGALVEEYDPVMDQWATKASMPTCRMGLVVSVVNGKIYAMGGTSWAGDEGCTPYCTTVEEYDPATDTWTNCGGSCAPMPTVELVLVATYWHSGVVAVNNKIYAIGSGQVDSGEYDPVTNQWTRKAPVSWGYSAEPWGPDSWAVGVVNNKIYVIGQGGNYLTKVAEYEPAADQWTARESMPKGRGYSAAGVVGDKIYAIGGTNPEACFNEEGEYRPFLCLGTVEEYDPVTNQWTMKARMPNPAPVPVPAGLFYGVGVANNKIYVISNPVLEYDPATDQWTMKTRVLTHRCELAVGVVNNKIYVIWGTKADQEGDCIGGGGGFF